MGFWLTLVIVPLGVGATFLAYRILKAYSAYQGVFVCAWPADGRTALARLRAWRAAFTSLRDRSSLQVAECSHWPERQNCTQSCLAEIEEYCRIHAQVSR